MNLAAERFLLAQIERIADAYERSASAAEESVALSRKAVEVQAQLASSSKALEASLATQLSTKNSGGDGE